MEKFQDADFIKEVRNRKLNRERMVIMKKCVIFMAMLLSVSMAAFADCSRGKITNSRTGYFSEIAGYWAPEQELASLSEIRKTGDTWYYIEYDFSSGTYRRYKMSYSKNGIFLQSSDFNDGEYYLGYDTKLKSIVTVDRNLCIVGESGKVNRYISKIYSKEGYTNVRTGPSKSSRVKRQIPNGTKVIVAEYSEHNDTNPGSDWVEVMYFNYEKGIAGEGFIHKSQMK